MKIVLLSGGSGRRLWPLSNDVYAKQYIKLVEGEDSNEKYSMIQRVWKQLEICNLVGDAVIIANTAQHEIIQNQLGNDINVAIEPEQRDTFPAVMLSCAYIKSVINANSDDFVVVLPVDPYTEIDFFKLFQKLEVKMKETGTDIGLIGARPTYPSEKYGYIIPQTNYDDFIEVQGFVEKPDSATAVALIEKEALWNCGVVCFRLSLAEKYLQKYNVDFDYQSVYDHYLELPKISFDYEVLEKSSSQIALVYDGVWKDLGTWNTLTEEMASDTEGFVIRDDFCEDSNAVNMLDIPVVMMGIKNAVVAVSHDGILVADKDRSSYLKDCIKDLKDVPRYEERRWGSIKILERTLESQVQSQISRIKIMNGMSLSYHYHQYHDEVLDRKSVV